MPSSPRPSEVIDPASSAGDHLVKHRTQEVPLHLLLERERQRAFGTAKRIETTLAHLATAPHRTLTDPRASALRSELAQLDAVLARLPAAGPQDAAAGAQEMAWILRRLEAGAARPGSGHLRELLEERSERIAALTKADPSFVEDSKPGALERAMANPRMRRTPGALEKLRSKATRRATWISGKTSRVEGVLDKALAVGERLHGALELVQTGVPQIAEMLGGGGAGRSVARLGEWEGAGDSKLAAALDWGKRGRGVLGTAHGHLDRALGQAGVKDPAKAYEKMSARSARRHDERGALEEMAFLKLEAHRRRRPDLHPAAGAQPESPPAAPPDPPKSALERALDLGRGLGQKAAEVGRGVHRGLGKVHDVVGKGIEGAGTIDHGLERTSALARQAAAFLGEDSGLGKSLLGIAERSDRAHAAMAQGIELAQDYDQRLGKVDGALGEVLGPETRHDGKVDRGGSEDQPADAGSGPRGTTSRRAGARERDHTHAGARECDRTDEQELDSAALDTWIGTGEGASLFSDVFGAFLPADGQPAAHPRRPGDEQDDRGGPVREKSARPQRHGFFHGLVEHLHGFAERVSSLAGKGDAMLGKAMHWAEKGMHGVSAVAAGAAKMQTFAAQAEGFFDAIHLGRVARVSHRIGWAAGRIEDEAHQVHGGLETADRWMGEGREVLQVFQASRSGEGIDGRLQPERVRLGSALDEPRRIDLATLGRMEAFLGGSLGTARIHTGPGAAEVTRRFGADAVTVKDHIFFAPGRYSPQSLEGERLIAHELTHVLQRTRRNLDVRTAEGEALHAERSYGSSPEMHTLELAPAQPDFRLPADGAGLGPSTGVHTAKRNRSRGSDAAAMDQVPDGEELLEQVSGRVYELLMDDLEQSFESR